MNLARRRIGVLAGIAALAAGTSACSEDSGDESRVEARERAAVTIDTFIFQPDPLEVDAGTAVTFTNADDILHTVTEGTRDDSVRGSFDERLDGAGTSAEVTFDQPGRVEYVCTIHAGMDGTVIVRWG